MKEYAEAFPEARITLKAGLEDSLQYYAVPVISSNFLKRLNRESHRLSRVASPFPSLASYLRLMTCYLIEYTEDWSTGRACVSRLKIDPQAEGFPNDD